MFHRTCVHIIFSSVLVAEALLMSMSTYRTRDGHVSQAKICMVLYNIKYVNY